jgi:hypothetical protein
MRKNYKKIRDKFPFEYNSWTSMIGRCLRPNHSKFPSYGAKGIKVCDRWLDFYTFIEDMGPKPEGYSIERKDNSLGYSRDNCIWANAIIQNRNRSNTIRLEVNGIDLYLREWCEMLDLSYPMIYGRLKRGIPPSEALTLERGRHWRREAEAALL